MRVFVTGGSGFVGGHVIERLSAAHEVLAMARSERSARIVQGYGAVPVRCSLSDVSSVHLEGIDAIVHAAAFVEEWGSREQFWEGNVEGTQRMLDAARGAGVGRFVHIGTEAVLFDGRDLIDVDEAWPYPERHRFLYSETKAEAERRVLAADGAMTTISLRPRLVWGPRDGSVLPAIVRMVEAGSYAWIDGGQQRTSTTHVANLAHAVDLALSRGRGGRAYFVVDGEQHTMRAFLTQLAATQGVALPDRSLPSWLARPAARLVEGSWRLLGRTSTPPITRFAIEMMSATVTVRGSRAAEELGYVPQISVDEGMAALAGEAPRAVASA